MNVFLDDSWVEVAHRLALGIEPIDAIRWTLLPRYVDVMFDGAPLPLPPRLWPPGTSRWYPPNVLRRVERHESGRFAVRLGDALESPVALRFDDRRRRYVPRRIEFPITELADVVAAEQTGVDVTVEARTRRPALYPGAAYDTVSTATGIRGRVQHPGGSPARWVRVEAIATDLQDALGGRAHGDDRGEFLLILGPIPGDIGALPQNIDIAVDVTVRGPAPPPTPLPEAAHTDPLWDLPLESVDPADPVDDVSAGIKPVATYTRSAQRGLTLPLGRITSIRQPFVLS